MERYVCPICGFVLKKKKSKYYCDGCNKYFDEETDYIPTQNFSTNNKNDIPVGCSACGGPYPYCKTSCKIFDD